MTAPTTGPVRYEYRFTDFLTGRLLAVLPLRDVSLSEVLDGPAPGQAAVPLADRQVLPRDPYTATTPRRTMMWALRHRFDDDGRRIVSTSVPWAGIVQSREASRSARALDLKLTTWPGYYARRRLPRLPFFFYDSLDLFRAVLDYGTSQTPGAGPMVTDPRTLRAGPTIDLDNRPPVVPLFVPRASTPGVSFVWVKGRRNLAPDPAGRSATSGAWLNRYPGQGALTFRTGQADGPPGTGITSYVRRTVTAASGAAGVGIDHHGNLDDSEVPLALQLPVAQRLAVTPGQQVAVSSYVRSSVTSGGNLRCRFYNAGGIQVGDWFYSTITRYVAGQWARLTATAQAPDDAAYLVARSNYMYAGNLAVGDTFDATGLLVEQGTGIAGDYFDGDTTDTADARASWAGTPHASPSVMEVRTVERLLVGDSVTRQYDGETVLDAAQELSSTLGFDWRFVPYLDPAADVFAPRLRLDVGRPRLGRVAPRDLRWSADRRDGRSRWGYLADYSLSEDGSNAVNYLLAKGADDGAGNPLTYEATAAQLGIAEVIEGMPLYDGELSAGDLASLGRLRDAALAELAARLASQTRITGIKVRGDLLPDLSTYDVGDDGTFRADRKVHGRDLTLVGQIIGRTIEPPQQGRAEWVTMDVQGTVS